MAVHSEIEARLRKQGVRVAERLALLEGIRAAGSEAGASQDGARVDAEALRERIAELGRRIRSAGDAVRRELDA